MAATPSLSTRILEGAHDLVINNPTFIVNESTPPPRERPGLDRLLEHSMRDAFHNSASRWPPPRCHYDSRQEFRTTITDWGTGRSNDIPESLLWMHGPFGVGKSAIAQSCAEALAEENKLGASLFFSRPNNRNDPDRVFTSIAYQLALKCPSFGDILDREILKDPTLLTAARPVQFRELLMKPLLQVIPQDPRIEGWVIILDGLDEIEGVTAQVEIINIVAISIRARSTPFRWFILSRPEPHIQRAMRADHVSALSHHLDLPLSSEDDHEILTFFEKELEKIGKQHNLPPSWCSEAKVAILVKLASGLWIYVNTVTRFIDDPNSLGPVTQLDLVLTLANESRGKLPTNPLAAMDLFYGLIMRQIPSHVISTVCKILLLNKVFPNRALELANVLGLSWAQFHTSCGFLQSVLHLRGSLNQGVIIQFYHASFMEYVGDPGRSGDFCIYGKVLQELYQQIIQQLGNIHARSKGTIPVVSVTCPQSPPDPDDIFLVYNDLVYSLLQLFINPNCSISPSTAVALQSVNFSKFYTLLKRSPSRLYDLSMQGYEQLRRNLPPEYRDKIVRKSSNVFYYLTKPKNAIRNRPIILGQGRSKLVCWKLAGYSNYLLIPQGSQY